MDNYTLWIGLGTAVILVLIVVLVAYQKGAFASNSKNASSGNLPTSAPSIDGLKCNATEQLVYHQHAKLDIYVNGKHFTIPPLIGSPQNANCLYWMHTHALTSYPQGVIHMEFPATPPKPTPTLVRFFHVWEKTRADDMAPVPTILAGGPNVRIYINGVLTTKPLASIILKPHMNIAIETGSKYVKPPKFNFAAWQL